MLASHGVHGERDLPGQRRHQPAGNPPRGASARSPSATHAPRCSHLPPTGRVARPDDIARLAVFLASEQSDHITGQAWTVDGGMVMH
jgi:NAD(P)-dependent dehydrogenase (short-subunit alcohol dehydrogenase family)